MEPTNKTARIAGALYLLMGIPAPFCLIYIPRMLIVPGNATATARNILASEMLFRTGIVAELFVAILLGSLALPFRPAGDAIGIPSADPRFLAHRELFCLSGRHSHVVTPAELCMECREPICRHPGDRGIVDHAVASDHGREGATTRRRRSCLT